MTGANQRSDIGNFNGSKGSNMSYETVDSGPDIDVPNRIALKNKRSYEQVLMKIMARCRARLVCKILKNGISVGDSAALFLKGS
jgi:hypothetical protein